MTKNIQFLKLPVALNGKDTRQVVALTHIADRMQSSQQRKQFYSETHHDFFVIYTNNELAQDLAISTRTVSRILKKLVDDDYLEIELTNHRVNKIFMTAKAKEIFGIEDTQIVQANDDNLLVDKSQNVLHSMPKCLTNQINNNQINNTSNTCVTTKDDNNIPTPTQPQKQPQSTSQANHAIQQQLVMDSLETSIIERCGLPTKAVHILKTLSFNKPQVLYHYVNLILRAKSFVIKKAKANCWDFNSLVFDTNNQPLNDDFNNHIFRIIMNANKKAHNRDKYMMSALINFFEDHYNQYQTVANVG